MSEQKKDNYGIRPVFPNTQGKAGRTDAISDVAYEPEWPGKSAFVRPVRMRFSHKLPSGETKRRTWDLVESHDAVAIVLYHREEDAYILVRQFRPAVFHSLCKKNEKLNETECIARAFTYELCAGIIDKEGKSLEEIASEEIAEECGFRVEAKDIKATGTCRGNVGITGNLIHMFYAEVDSSMRISDGGGSAHEGEDIEVVFLPRKSVREWLFDTTYEKPASIFCAFFDRV